jgi:hypothetical protein
VFLDQERFVPFWWPCSSRHAKAEVGGEEAAEEHDFRNDKEKHP